MNIYNSKLKNFAALFFSSFLMLFVFTGFSSAQSAKSAIAGQARAAGISANIPQAAATAPAANKTARNPEREWLVMVYINAKNDLGLLPNAFMSVNDMERIGSTDKVAVVVEYGAFEKHNGISVHSEDSKTILIQKDNDTRKVNSPVINRTKRADMGDYSHLADFASHAIKAYPAKHNMLVVWNHGKGIDGISFDDITGHHISVKELGIALNKIKDSLGRKLDMFIMDACLMQSFSIAYELRNSADVIIGSQEAEPINGLPYHWMLDRLNKSEKIDFKSFCDDLVDAFKKNNPNATEATMSALDTSSFHKLIILFNKWIYELRQDPSAFADAMSALHVKESRNINDYDYRDLLDYLSHVNGSIKPSKAKSAGENLISFIKKYVIISNYSNDERINGLTIYIPSGDYYNPDYWSLDFSKDSAWSLFNAELAEKM